MGTLNFLDRLSFPFALSLCLCLCLSLSLASILFTTPQKKVESRSRSRSQLLYHSPASSNLPPILCQKSRFLGFRASIAPATRRLIRLDSSMEANSVRFFFSCFVYKLCCLVPEKILGEKFKFCWFFWPIDKVPSFLF